MIVVLSDQQRWDTLGCYGQAAPLSPNLDALAARQRLSALPLLRASYRKGMVW